jgi:hypothetical protein
LWNCPKSSCHGAFPDTRNPLEPSQVKNSPFLRGTRGVVLLSSRVWKDVNGWALEIGISCTYSNPVVTRGQKHTHTHIPPATVVSGYGFYDTILAPGRNGLAYPTCLFVFLKGATKFRSLHWISMIFPDLLGWLRYSSVRCRDICNSNDMLLHCNCSCHPAG